MTANPDRRDLHVMILGESAVGKTAMIKRYMDDSFDEDQMITVGVDFVNRKYVMPDGIECSIKVWDTAGQERF